jgi:hypothetical protein
MALLSPVLLIASCSLTTAQKAAIWDLSTPRTAEHFRGEFDDLIAIETFGRDGIDMQLTLPGGEVVRGKFGFAIASEGAAGALTSVSLSTTDRYARNDWQTHVSTFIHRWGGDADAITKYVEQVRAGGGDELYTNQSFLGKFNGLYNVALDRRPVRGDTLSFVVEYRFTLNYAELG